jgi:hypothetical protein
MKSLHKFGEALLLVICGGGLGWLIGLSAAPVIQGVITSLLTIVTGFAAVSSGMRAKEGAEAATTTGKAIRAVHALPVAAIVVGIAVGSSFGVYARTNQWLGPNPEYWEHTTASKIEERLFDIMFPMENSIKENKEKQTDTGMTKEKYTKVPSGVGLLFAVSADTCSCLRGAESRGDDELKKEIEQKLTLEDKRKWDCQDCNKDDTSRKDCLNKICPPRNTVHP